MARTSRDAAYVHQWVLEADYADLKVQVHIDIDCMDPNEATRWHPFRPHDQTSNQRIVHEQMITPNNRELFHKTVKECKGRGWEYVLMRMVS